MAKRHETVCSSQDTHDQGTHDSRAGSFPANWLWARSTVERQTRSQPDRADVRLAPLQYVTLLKFHPRAARTHSGQRSTLPSGGLISALTREVAIRSRTSAAASRIRNKLPPMSPARSWCVQLRRRSSAICDVGGRWVFDSLSLSREVCSLEVSDNSYQYCVLGTVF